ncbi:MAG: hypothetical protein DRZ76_00960 [Candidatus Nealsonbacteria bacterium]|nr:MAG: hypothetical protein DRZ76_00960 [Candidatus Nealsonbacteria bacterium]
MKKGARMTEAEKILAECRNNLKRGRAVATGIGVFVIMVRNGDPLLRRRLEKESLYQQDLSGKWEMPGGGAELSHFLTWAEDKNAERRYCGSIFEALKQEMAEETGLALLGFPDHLLMVPAWFRREYINKETDEERVTIDVAFSLPIPFEAPFIEETKVFHEKLERRELMFVPRNKLQEIEIVSPRMRFLIERGLEVYDLLGE